VGWILPAPAGSRYAGTTVLYLPSGDGSLADATETLGILHGLGVRVFAFDYRGYGQSVAVHPNQAGMTEDAERAFAYLTTSQGVPEGEIVPYGAGVGGSMAAHLAQEHKGVPAVIVESPGPDPLAMVENAPRTKYLPVQWLLHDRFPLAEPLAGLKTPKLLMSPEMKDARLAAAADPKRTVFAVPLPTSAAYGPMMRSSLAQFFEEYVAGAKVQPLIKESPK